MDSRPVLVTGSTGYVGTRLVPLLLSRGVKVRAVARNPSKVRRRQWSGHPNLEVAAADVLDMESLSRASRGCRAVYYLVHSMTGEGDFVQRDRAGARNMAGAAEQGGADRIIYLGGLGEEGASLSKHLRSRMEVAEILRSGKVPATHLRCGMILGSGSASFEILRYLVERLPVMVTPRWVHTPCQPIAIRDVLTYLTGCLDRDGTQGQTFDIGGPEVLTYRRVMDIYAEEARLWRRLVVPVPVLTPRLSSYWIHLVTPVHAAIARPLAEGLATPVLCKDDRIRSVVPLDLMTCRSAIRESLDRVGQQRREARGADPHALPPPEWLRQGDAPYAGGTVLNAAYRITMEAHVEDVWQPVAEIGGRNGWYFADFLWVFRGRIDRLVGGAGLRKGRRHPKELKPGDGLDFWKVLVVEPPRRLLLLAEMRFPGEATLGFDVSDLGDGRAELRQVSRFLPRGLWGMLYWYVLYPIHAWLFRGMLKSIGRRVGKSLVSGPDSFDPGKGASP